MWEQRFFEGITTWWDRKSLKIIPFKLFPYHVVIPLQKPLFRCRKEHSYVECTVKDLMHSNRVKLKSHKVVGAKCKCSYKCITCVNSIQPVALILTFSTSFTGTYNPLLTWVFSSINKWCEVSHVENVLIKHYKCVNGCILWWWSNGFY